MVNKITFNAPAFQDRIDALVNGRRDVDTDVDEVVREILEKVRTQGDAAVLDYTEKFDRLALAGPAAMRFSKDEIEAARSECSNETIAALEHAANRIDVYHRKQIPAGFDYIDDDGVRLGSRWTAISSVGLYVPGGTAAYPSSVLMNAVPARVAGVERLVMVVPTPDGVLNPLVLAAASIAGVDEIYRIGGAQAVAAWLTGRGQSYLLIRLLDREMHTLRQPKRRVFGVVGIDMIAGPSEILVVADAENDPPG